MASIWRDPDVFSPTDENQITKAPFSLNDKLTVEQVARMGPVLWKLHDRVHKAKPDSTAPVDWPEWQNFITLSYDLGFVCRDASDQMDDGTLTINFIKRLERDKNLVHSLSLREIRQIIHYLVRSERWGDGGGEKGAGTLYSFVEAGLADAIAIQLS